MSAGAANFPMALDTTHDRLFVVTRRSPHLVVFDTNVATIERCSLHDNGKYGAAPCGAWTASSNRVTMQYNEAYNNSTATATDAKRSKPDPDIVHAAIEASGIPASQLLMIGDTPYDIEAATKAQVRIIAFRSGAWGDTALKGAADIYDGPADLRSRYDSSLIRRARESK